MHSDAHFSLAFCLFDHINQSPWEIPSRHLRVVVMPRHLRLLISDNQNTKAKYFICPLLEKHSVRCIQDTLAFSHHTRISISMIPQGSHSLHSPQIRCCTDPIFTLDVLSSIENDIQVFMCFSHFFILQLGLFTCLEWVLIPQNRLYYSRWIQRSTEY